MFKYNNKIFICQDCSGAINFIIIINENLFDIDYPKYYIREENISNVAKILDCYINNIKYEYIISNNYNTFITLASDYRAPYTMWLTPMCIIFQAKNSIRNMDRLSIRQNKI